MSEGTMTVSQKVSGIRDLLARSKEEIAMALPRHVTPERMLRVAMTAVQRTPGLLECDPKSLIGSIVQASQLGLEPDGILGHAYLVPFRNNKTGRKECTLIPGYKGLIDLTRRSGNVSTIFAQVVYEKDRFEFAYGLEPRCDHAPSRSSQPGEMIAVYAVCRLRDGGAQFEVMWKRQIDAIRQQSKAAATGPWVTHYEEMAKKTVLRRLCKLLPVSIEIQNLVALDERADAGLSQGMAQVIDFSASEPAPPSSLDSLAERLNGNSTPENTPEGDTESETAEPAPAATEEDAAAARSLRQTEYEGLIDGMETEEARRTISEELRKDKVLTPQQVRGFHRELAARAKELGLLTG